MKTLKLKESHFVVLLCILTIVFTYLCKVCRDDSGFISLSKYEIKFKKQDSIINILKYKVLERDSLIKTLNKAEDFERDTVFMLLENKFEMVDINKDSLIEEAIKAISSER